MTLPAQFPILIVAVPLLTALVIGLTGLYSRKLCFPLALAAMAFSFGVSLMILIHVVDEGPFSYRLGGWEPRGGIEVGIEYVVDHLNAMVLVVVAFVGLVAAVFSKRSVEDEIPDKIALFYTLFVLFVTGMLGITITGDAFNLYVLLEIAALTSYALIAAGKGRAQLSSFNYLIMGTIGACFYLLGVGHLFIMTGYLNMPDLQGALAGLYETDAVQVAFVLILLGLWVKMAFFPVHGWLPNAYTHAPSATSCLMAPLMTKVSVYVMIRIMFSVFSEEFAFDLFALHNAVVWFAVAAIVAGSVMALAQRSFKKMLTYIIVAEVGYMVGGVWLANQNGIQGAILHILNDAMMTLCLFLVAGIVVYKTKGHSIENMRGLFRRMPLTMAAFTVGALSMIGVPPTCGFFSKWYLLLGAIEAGRWEFMAALILSSLVNAVIFFRIIEVAFFERPAAASTEPRAGEHVGAGHHGGAGIDEAPLSMLVPLLVVAVLLIVIGVFTGEIIENLIQHAVPASLGR
jgi:multicomponent Na+:H+ antiporter subunit D